MRTSLLVWLTARLDARIIASKPHISRPTLNGCKREIRCKAAATSFRLWNFPLKGINVYATKVTQYQRGIIRSQARPPFRSPNVFEAGHLLHLPIRNPHSKQGRVTLTGGGKVNVFSVARPLRICGVQLA